MFNVLLTLGEATPSKSNEVTFAEAGEFDTARQMMEEEEDEDQE